MTDLASELAILEDHYAQVESGLADRKAAQQAELQALADEFNAENVAAAREMVLTEGKIDYVKSKLRQATNGHEQASDVSLLDRIHRSAEAAQPLVNAAVAAQSQANAESEVAIMSAWSGRELSVPDNDPD